ncbi:MAG: hypothetical protein ACFCGT_25880 [Sandaracinaceae bacterium]
MQSSSARALLALLTLAGAIGCVGPAPPPVETAVTATAPPPRLCEGEDRLRAASLRAHRSGARFVFVSDVRVRAAIRRVDGAPRLDIALDDAGWHLFGWLDLSRDRVLALMEALWLEPEVLALPAASHVRVLDARPGELRVGIAEEPVLGVRLLDPLPSTWVPCDQLTLSNPQPEDGFESLGLRETRRIRLAPGSRFSLARAPNGPPYAAVQVGDRPWRAYVLEERDGAARLVLRGLDAVVIGWAARSELDEVDMSRDRLVALGALREQVELDLCRSPARLPLTVQVAEAAPEVVGTLEPGATFRLIERQDDGTLQIGTGPDHDFGKTANATWLLQPKVEPECEHVVQGAPLGGQLEAAH